MKCLSFLFLFLTLSCGKSHLFGALTGEKPNVLTQSSQGDFENWPNSRYQFDLRFNTKPKVSINSPFQLYFWDSYQDSSIGPYLYLNSKLCVLLWMKMPSGTEHGSSPVEVIRVDDHYEIDDVYFIMPGTWKIYIRTIEQNANCTKDSSFIEEAIVEVTL